MMSFFYVHLQTFKNNCNMDLFSKKKVARLQNELALKQAMIEATEKELSDLKQSCLDADKELTEYFGKKYNGKYYKYKYESPDGTKNCLKFQVKSTRYTAGMLVMHVYGKGFDNDIPNMSILIRQLKELQIISKAEFMSEN